MNKVLSFLDKNNINYEIYRHPAVYTVAQAQEYTGHLEAIHCKNLFLRNRKGNTHYLFVFEEKRQINLKEISELIGSTNLSFASKERLEKYLKVKPGSVSPFGLLNDTDRCVKIYLDKSLYHARYMTAHPNDNTITIKLETKDLMTILENLGYRIESI